MPKTLPLQSMRAMSDSDFEFPKSRWAYAVETIMELLNEEETITARESKLFELKLSITEKYCLHCGAENTGHHCHCQNDD